MNILILNAVYDKLFTESFEDAIRGNQSSRNLKDTESTKGQIIIYKTLPRKPRTSNKNLLKDKVVPAALVAPVVLLLLQIRWLTSHK